MIQVSISATDMEVLQEERYTHPHPRVQRKLHALYWVGLGLPRHVVARIVGVSEGTVRNDLHAYEQGGLEALRQCNPHPTSAALHAYADTIRQTFIAEPPHPVQEAIERIEALTGIRRSPTAVRREEQNPVSHLAKSLRWITRSSRAYHVERDRIVSCSPLLFSYRCVLLNSSCACASTF